MRLAKIERSRLTRFLEFGATSRYSKEVEWKLFTKKSLLNFLIDNPWMCERDSKITLYGVFGKEEINFIRNVKTCPKCGSFLCFRAHIKGEKKPFRYSCDCGDVFAQGKTAQEAIDQLEWTQK